LDLSHNYHELRGIQRLLYWIRYRWQLTPEDRFFFEGHRPLPGQMYLAERRALYAAVVQRKPKFCFEIGTASGGGSTFFIASAFRHVGSGQLISLEAVEAASRRAAHRYGTDLKHLQPHVEFLAGRSPQAFMPYIRKSDSTVECVFLDGSDTPEETVEQYEFFLPFAREGTTLMAHDWNDMKMSLLRPRIEADRDWHLLSRLDEPKSVGFVVYSRTDAGA
jgi:predicted O-methyltransferase YrrM